MLTFYSEILETISRRYELNKPTAGITRREAHLTGKAIYPHLCGVLIPEAPRKSFWVYQNP
jgi:hypothetical protein